MKLWKSFLVIVFSIQTIMAFGEEHDTVPAPEKVYYVSLKDKLTLYLFGITKLNQFELVDADNKNSVYYAPNESFNIGLGFNYRWAGIGAAFNFGFINKDDDIYGKTKSFDLQTDIYTNKMVLSVALSFYEGFYWQNVDDYYPGWNIKDSVIIRPDIETFNFAAGAIYTFNNKKFSFRAVYSNTEWQKHSAGSMLAAGSISYYSVAADSSLIPGILQSYYPLYDSLTNLNTFSFGGAFGYTHTFVIKQKVFINATLLIGISLQAYKAKDILGSDLGESKVSPSANSHFRLALGYNSDKSYFGISAVIDNYIFENKNHSEFIRNYGKVRIFYGRRFNVAKKKDKLPEN